MIIKIYSHNNLRNLGNCNFYTVAIVLLPRLNKDSEIKEIDYVSFVNMVNGNQVKKAEVRDRTIAFEVEKMVKKLNMKQIGCMILI